MDRLLGISKSIIIVAIVIIAVGAGVLGYYYTATQPPAPQATVPAAPRAGTPATTPLQVIQTTPTTPQITGPTPVATTQIPTKTTPLTIKTLRIGTPEAGSIGYVVGSILADIIRKLYPDLEVSTYPVGGDQ